MEITQILTRASLTSELLLRWKPVLWLGEIYETLYYTIHMCIYSHSFYIIFFHSSELTTHHIQCVAFGSCICKYIICFDFRRAVIIILRFIETYPNQRKYTITTKTCIIYIYCVCLGDFTPLWTRYIYSHNTCWVLFYLKVHSKHSSFHPSISSLLYRICMVCIYTTHLRKYLSRIIS